VREHAIGGRAAPVFVGGCREKPLEKARSTLPDLHLRAAVRDALATERLRATDEMAVFGTTLTSDSARSPGVPDSHVEIQNWRRSRAFRRPANEQVSA
jgi:hypothetical protein